MADSIPFEPIPNSGRPVEIPGRGDSLAWGLNIPGDIFVPIHPATEATRTVYLRFIAHWQDNQPTGGQTPTFLIGAGNETPSSVAPELEDVPVLDVDSNFVGSARCVQQPDDVFLITISKIDQRSANNWNLQIHNNDSRRLGFFGFLSMAERGTLRPWAEYLPKEIYLQTSRFKEIAVRNRGTADLIFTAAEGDPIRGTGDLVILKKRPNVVKLHGADQVILASRALTSLDSPNLSLNISIPCNDPANSGLALKLIRPEDPGDPVFCRDCSCPGYVGPGAGHPCRRSGCGHPYFSHFDREDRPNPDFPSGPHRN